MSGAHLVAPLPPRTADGSRNEKLTANVVASLRAMDDTSGWWDMGGAMDVPLCLDDLLMCSPRRLARRVASVSGWQASKAIPSHRAGASYQRARGRRLLGGGAATTSPADAMATGDPVA